jgi:hypothetical protein
MLRNAISILAVISVIPVMVLAQARVDPKPAIEAVKRAAFLEGNWSGEGWIQMGQGTKEEFMQIETVESKLDGAVMVIEGIGHSKGDNPKKIHHALVFSSFIAENTFTWSFSPPNGGQIRYSILIENDTWNEVGEYSRDGQTWYKFFEMNLKRI